MVLFFSIFLISKLSMAVQLKTYGSAKLRVVFIDYKRGDRINTDTLFENLYDFWTSYHDSNKSIFKWYRQKIRKFEMSIRKKWNPKFCR